MPKRKVLQTVIVHRDGQRLKPAIGEIFDFKQDELDSINAINPDALGRPLVEVDQENIDAAKEKTAQADAPKTDKKKPGKDKASDEEEV